MSGSMTDERFILQDENIIIDMDTGEAILVDFGAAALISEPCTKEFQGYCINV